MEYRIRIRTAVDGRIRPRICGWCKAHWLKVKPTVLARERMRGRIHPFRIVRGQYRYTLEMLERYLREHPSNRAANQSAEPAK